MINSASLRRVQGSRFSQGFVKPCYDSYCFAHIPSTISYLLTGHAQSSQRTLPLDVLGKLPSRYERVVLFFIDGFGWKFFERYANRYPFLQTFLKDGVVSKLTSQFPSTTAAHVTCIHTGLDVGQSGVYEWNYYEPLVDEMISPLLFSFAGEKNARETLRRTKISQEAFFPSQTFYESLQANGVTSHILQYHSYTASTYSEVVFRGATVHPYQQIQDGLGQAVTLLQAPTHGPTYYFLYFDRIDTTSHRYGPSSRQTEEAIDAFLTQMEQLFLQQVRGKVRDTLFIMTADHGQVEVNPRLTCYLNREIGKCERYMKRNQRGQLLVPAGSARDMFLYIEDKYVDQAVQELQQQLSGRAEVYPTQKLIEQQFFGLQPPSSTLLARLGNVVILPYKYETVWWYIPERFEMHFHGHHGGLTPEEMEIPLLLLPL